VEYLADTALLREARAIAEEVLESDPSLENFPRLRAWVTDQPEFVQS